jgi:hypothetical protein
MANFPPEKESDRPATTYYELGNRDDDLGQKPAQALPRITSGPWASDPVPPEPPSDVGALCGNTVGVALGGASPSKREEPAK